MKVLRAIPFESMRLLIFDLDGTLIDSREDLANSVNAMLRHLRRPPLPHNVIASYIGDGAPMLVRRALGDPDDPGFVEDALEFFLSYYREHKLDHTYVYDGVFESLDVLQQALPNAKMAVLSNKPVGPSGAIVKALGLEAYFFQVYGGNSFHTKKPDPHGIDTLRKQAGDVEPGEAVLIGDSEIDVLAARNAGIFSVGCLFGLSPASLDGAPPDVLVDSASEWQQLLQPVSR